MTELAKANEDDDRIVLVLAGPPLPHVARLMATLGVPVKHP